MVRQFLGAAAAIVAADIFTKWLVNEALPSGGFIPIIGSSVGLTAMRNTGAAFGTFKGWNPLFIALSIAAIIALVLWHKKLAPWKGGALLCGIICGGVIGNLFDRLVYGSVFDFISIGWWPAFNIADSALTLGVIALIYESVRT